MLSKSPESDEVSKIFEEEHALANNIYWSVSYMHIPKWFTRRAAARLKYTGIYRRDLVVKAYRARPLR